MRIASTFAAIFLGAIACAQTWDKPIAPGLTFHMEYDATLPRTIYALRYSLASTSVKASPELANGTVYSDDEFKGRETVSEMVARTGAIAGINGDYFPFTGDPLGLMVRDGQLLSVPVKPRAAFGWGNGTIAAGVIDWKITLTAEGMDPLDVDGINMGCGPNLCIINDPQAGIAISSKPATCVVVKPDGPPMLGPQGQFVGTVQNVFGDATNIPLGNDALLIMGEGDKAPYLNALKPGQKITFDVENEGLDWTKITNVIGGGPLLVQGGHPFIDWQDQDFKPEFAQQRHPRTAVGRTVEGDIWFVAVDGRQASSVGARLDEMAEIMIKLGCTDAINLDGGGSTAINLLGLLLNRPNEKQAGQEAVVTERKVANAVLLFGDVPKPDGSVLRIATPEKVMTSDSPDLTVVREDGAVIPNNEVIWAASGAAFIDQGGRLHVLGAGVAKIQAFARGAVVSGQVMIEAPPKPEDPAAKPPQGVKQPSKGKPKALGVRRYALGVRRLAFSVWTDYLSNSS